MERPIRAGVSHVRAGPRGCHERRGGRHPASGGLALCALRSGVRSPRISTHEPRRLPGRRPRHRSPPTNQRPRP
nr:MAG TPA: hypothetical protein [Caudoviricetes sp.]